ncbi:MAG: AAA family ATPase [Candidatus Poseidoniaceae archaeon]
MSAGISKVNVPVQERVMLHLLENDTQADRYFVGPELTRPGIAESCALHPPNVSRTMRDLLKKSMVSEHTRNIKGDDRRQKTWQLTEEGRIKAMLIKQKLSSIMVVIRDSNGDLLELESASVPSRLDANISLLQVLMHAQHEGVLTYGDIRFGAITNQGDDNQTNPPGRLKALTGVHATYNNQPPQTRIVHGRTEQSTVLENWFNERKPCMVVHGIAGIGKSTLVAHWLNQQMEKTPNLSVCWYPCQPWDTSLGLATSLLHRFGIDESHDPYNLIETLPLNPGGQVDVDMLRRRLLAYLTDARTIRERFKDEVGGPPPYWLIVLDDVHHIEEKSAKLLGAMLQISQQSPLRIIMISRSRPSVYDRRDVHTRDLVSELALKGLSIKEMEDWMNELEISEDLDSVFKKTGGHPLALELFELYGQSVHIDWLQFLDDEILFKLPEDEKRLLTNLANYDKPLPWKELAQQSEWSGPPPKALISYGILIELDDGMWLHEALRERLLRDINSD